MKTIREHLSTLPEPYRTQALNNTEATYDFGRDNLAAALSDAFYWDESPEGHDYWNETLNRIELGEIVPQSPDLSELSDLITRAHAVADRFHAIADRMEAKVAEPAKPDLANTITTAFLDGLAAVLDSSRQTIRRVRLEAESGSISTEQAASVVKEVAETINSFCKA